MSAVCNTMRSPARSAVARPPPIETCARCTDNANWHSPASDPSAVVAADVLVTRGVLWALPFCAPVHDTSLLVLLCALVDYVRGVCVHYTHGA